MAHDSQVKNEEQQSSNESAKPQRARKRGSSPANSEQALEAQRKLNGQRECLKVIGKWMARFGAMPGAFADAAVDNFYATLAQCTESEALERAFIAAQEAAVSPEGRGFRPVPGEVLVAYRNEVANMPAKQRTHDKCEVCRGTGWKKVPRPADPENGVPAGYSWVVRCDGKAAA